MEMRTVAEAMQIAYNLKPKVESLEGFQNTVVTFFSESGYHLGDAGLLEDIFDAEVSQRCDGVYANLGGNNTFNGKNTFSQMTTFLGGMTLDTNAMVFLVGSTYYSLPTPVADAILKIVGERELNAAKSELQTYAMSAATNAMNTLKTSIQTGTITAYKAERDADGNVISSTYAKKGSDNIFSGVNYFTGITVFRDNVTMANAAGISFSNRKAFQYTIGQSVDMSFSLPTKMEGISEYTLATEQYIATITSAYDSGTRSVGYAVKASQDYNGDLIHTTYLKKSQVYNGLDSTSTSDALSAYQGKRLYDMMTDILDSDDQTLDELHEIVAYIKENRDLIAVVTAAKVSYSDIVDNLNAANEASKPLSARQGYVLKGLIDECHTTLLPLTSGAYDLGSAAYKYRNIYMSGFISDGTNSTTVAQIVNTGNAIGDINAVLDAINGEVV